MYSLGVDDNRIMDGNIILVPKQTLLMMTKFREALQSENGHESFLIKLNSLLFARTL